MAHIYMRFDFGASEEKAQDALHKLDVWKQAFRLDKKLQYKLERPEDAEEEVEGDDGTAETSASQENETDQKKGKVRGEWSAGKKAGSNSAPEGSLTLLVRLYFSAHEKLSQQRWLDRIPTEEPFKNASPIIIRQGDAAFQEATQQFDKPDYGVRSSQSF